MIRVKISDLLNGTEALQRLAGTNLKAKTAWQVARLLKSADNEIQAFNETRLDLIRKYGEKDENNGLVTDDKGNCRIPSENMNDFSNELNELINSSVEINANKILIEDLDGLDFTPNDMSVLETFIDFGEEE